MNVIVKAIKLVEAFLIQRPMLSRRKKIIGEIPVAHQ
jgi:hypothetical protein